MRGRKENRRSGRLSVSFKARLRWMQVIGSKLRINYERGTKEYSCFSFVQRITCSQCREPLTTIDPSVSNVDFKAVERDRQVTLQTLLHCDGNCTKFRFYRTNEDNIFANVSSAECFNITPMKLSVRISF